MQWEYLVHALDAEEVFSNGHVNPRGMQDVLNQHGHKGWELVSAFNTSEGHGGSELVVLTFKRPLDEVATRPTRPR